MTFEYTNIKKSVIAYKKYTYALNKKRPNNGGYYFRCVTTDCSASLLILNDRIITEKDYFEHSHFPALPIYSEYQVMLGKLKIQIVNEQLNISEVKKRYNDIYKILKSVLLNIKDASQELKLTKATTDFESGLQNSIAIVFNKNNNITIKACWFHFNQAIIRRISMLGLKMRYINDQDFRFWVRKFTALALIPEKIEDLEKAWGIIICETPTGDEELVDKFIRYFIDTWLLGRHGSHCIPSIWNRHKEKIRTNNNLEGYHSMMNKSLNPHSKITDVIDFFKTQDQKTSYEYLAEKAGKKEAKCYKSSKKINIDFDEKLEKIQSEYDNLSFEEYFYKLSFHVSFGHKKKIEKENEEGEVEDSEKVESASFNDQINLKYSFTNPYKDINFPSRIEFNLKKNEEALVNLNSCDEKKNTTETLLSQNKCTMQRSVLVTNKKNCNKLIQVKKEPEIFENTSFEYNQDILIEKENFNYAYRFKENSVLDARELLLNPWYNV
jgi:hypothetical protein